MKLTLWQQLDILARQITPFILTLAVMIAAMVPLQLPNFAQVMPWLALAAVYYWSVHRPDLMPAVAVFAVGVFHDLAAGTVLGVGAAALVLVHAAVLSQRRFFMSRSFLVIWLGFVVIAAGAILLAWLLNAALLGALIDPRPALFQFLTTIAVYPLVGWLFAQVQRSVLR